jgi:hypothetical protein
MAVSGGFSNGCIDLRHDFFGHQLHRAACQYRIDPVVSGIKQRAEVTGDFTESQQLVYHAVDRAGQHQTRRDGVGVDGVVWLTLVQLEQIGTAAKTDQLADQLLEVKIVRAF